MNNYIEFEMSSSLTYSSLVKAKMLCGMSIVLKQSKWLTDKEYLYIIKPNMIEDIPIYLCHPDIANRVYEICKIRNIEVIDYDNYLQGKNKERKNGF